MKRITRKNLDELAKEISILDDIHQKIFIGGTHYYDIASGTFLGTVGSSEDVRFVTPSEYAMCESTNEHLGNHILRMQSILCVVQRFNYNKYENTNIFICNLSF
ncbi:MAG: hypothetical protein WCS06_10665 [Dysgonamonadaceae bacterium]|jgi:hypothetical protein